MRLAFGKAELYPAGWISGKAPPKAGQWSHFAKQKEGCDKEKAVIK